MRWERMAKTLPHSENSSRASPRPIARRKRVAKARPAGRRALSRQALRTRRKFLHHFPGGFRDETYLDWERGYKWNAHQQWEAALNETVFARLIKADKSEEIAAAAIRIESRTNLLFSFEKMALRDAVKSAAGARAFATGAFDLLHGPAALPVRFDRWCETVSRLPRRQTRVCTWPVVTVIGFLAQPQTHFFLKPTVTRKAAQKYGVALPYAARPTWETYAGLLSLARRVRSDLRSLRPRDMIDIQSFLWVQGSDEYPAKRRG
jgi:hypothetical protein